MTPQSLWESYYPVFFGLKAPLLSFLDFSNYRVVCIDADIGSNGNTLFGNFLCVPGNIGIKVSCCSCTGEVSAASNCKHVSLRLQDIPDTAYHKHLVTI